MRTFPIMPKHVIRPASVAAFVASTLCCLPALAGRPLVTDDASVVDPGMCQVEASLQRGPGQGWFVPACNVAGDWEVGAGAGSLRQDGHWRRGATVRAKALLRPMSDDGWGAGVTLSQTQLVGSGVSDRAATLVYSAPLAPWAAWHANVGGIEHRAAGHGAGTWATALETTFGRQGLSLETFGERRAYRAWQAGWRWSALQDVLDLDAAWGVQHAAGARSTYAALGLTWTFPR